MVNPYDRINQKLIDRGYYKAYPMNKDGKSFDVTGKRAVIVKRSAALGDVLCSLPAVRAIKEKYGLPLVFSSIEKFRSLVENLPYVDSFTSAETLRVNSDELLINLDGVMQATKHMIDEQADKAQVFLKERNIDIIFSEKEKATMPKKKGYKITIHFRDIPSYSSTRNTPKVFMDDLISRILAVSENIHITVIGEKYHYAHERVTLTQNLTLRMVMQEISTSDLFIGPNSGYMHIAGALHIPMAIFETAFFTENFIHYGTDYHIIKSTVCTPCTLNECVKNTNACQFAVSISEIIMIIKHRIEKEIGVSIIIPMHNKQELTKKCIQKIRENSKTSDGNYEIIVVDNASQKPLAMESNVKYLCNKENLGFAKACNQGAREAKGKYLVFLNNDTEVQPGWLDYLLSRIAEQGVGIVGSKLILPNGDDTRMRDDYVCGASIITPRDVYFKVGGMEERYFAYFDDWDYCLKLKKAAYKIVYESRSIVIHHVASTSKTLPGSYEKIGKESYDIFVKKWGVQ